MSKMRIAGNFDWFRSGSEPEDLAAVETDFAARILFDMVLIRQFEHALLQLKQQGCIKGPIHSCVGQEVNGAAPVAALRRTDKVSGTHRAHHQFIAKLMRHALPDNWSPLAGTLPESGREVLSRTMAEIVGLASGYCNGRGGSMHLREARAGFIGSNAVVGGGIPIATGVAFAEKHDKSGNVVLCFLGDGATNQGTFHESCNLAAAWNLPIIYFIENNLYAGSTRTCEVSGIVDFSLRAVAYGMKGVIVEGGDPLGTYQAVREAVDGIRAGGGPCIIESKCYRHYHHTGEETGSSLGYRSAQEEKDWLKADGVSVFSDALIKAGKLSADQVDSLSELARIQVLGAVDSCVSQAPKRSVRAEKWPKPEAIFDFRHSDGAEWGGVKFSEPVQSPQWENKPFATTIADTILTWLEKDPRVVFLGEEVASHGSILDYASLFSRERLGARIIDTPISEAGFVGVACGAATSGMRPIVEIMYADFVLVAADQLFNQIDKIRSIYGNMNAMPLVVRTKVAAGLGYGGQHSMSPIALFSLFPGWRIAVPSCAADYIGLFNSAMHSLDPVLVVEYRALYDELSPVPGEATDYCIPFGRAKLTRVGNDLTLITYGPLVERCNHLHQRLALEGISCEVIDLRTVDNKSWDFELLGESLRKTGKAIVVEDAAASQGIGRMLACSLMERFFDDLESPIRCIAAIDVPTPASPALEAIFMVSDHQIIETVREMTAQLSFNEVVG